MAWDEIKHGLNSTLGTSDFEPLDKQIAKVSEMLLAGGIPVVKSVQRGYRGGTTSTENFTININTVDASKCLIEIMPSKASQTSSSGGVSVHTPCVVNLTSTVLTLTGSTVGGGSLSYSNVPFSWQIIEFY